MAINIQHRVENGKLIIEVNLAETHGLSSTGKSEIVAKSSGWLEIEGGFGLSMNVVKKVKRRGQDLANMVTRGYDGRTDLSEFD